jgi:hypothetical protein
MNTPEKKIEKNEKKFISKMTYDPKLDGIGAKILPTKAFLELNKIIHTLKLPELPA